MKTALFALLLALTATPALAESSGNEAADWKAEVEEKDVDHDGNRKPAGRNDAADWKAEVYEEHDNALSRNRGSERHSH